jgi:hypothetical protein
MEARASGAEHARPAGTVRPERVEHAFVVIASLQSLHALHAMQPNLGG